MKKTLTALTLAAGLLLAAVPASAAIIVSFVPSSTHINVGDDVNIDVSISGLGPEILSAVDINFLFAGGAATWTAAQFASLVTNLGGVGNAVFDFDPSTPGDLGVVAYSLLDDATLAAAQADSFLLGTFTMHGVTDGVTNIAFGPDPDFQRNFVGLDFLSLDVQLGSACVAVGTGSCDGGNAPEPGSLALIGMALLASVASRTRRRTRDMV